MQSKKSNRWEVAFTIFMLVLGAFVILLGVMFSYVGAKGILSVGEIDVNILMRDPSEYMTSKREVAESGLEVLLPGVVLLLVGAVVVTVSITRAIVLSREGRAIARLEQRIEKLENDKARNK
jgi:hypothetical protein